MVFRSRGVKLKRTDGTAPSAACQRRTARSGGRRARRLRSMRAGAAWAQMVVCAKDRKASTPPQPSPSPFPRSPVARREFLHAFDVVMAFSFLGAGLRHRRQRASASPPRDLYLLRQSFRGPRPRKLFLEIAKTAHTPTEYPGRSRGGAATRPGTAPPPPAAAPPRGATWIFRGRVAATRGNIRQAWFLPASATAARVGPFPTPATGRCESSQSAHHPPSPAR